MAKQKWLNGLQPGENVVAEDKELLRSGEAIANFLSTDGWKEIDKIFMNIYSNAFKEVTDNKDPSTREENRVKILMVKEIYEKITKGLKIGELVKKKEEEKIKQEVNKYVR